MTKRNLCFIFATLGVTALYWTPLKTLLDLITPQWYLPLYLRDTSLERMPHLPGKRPNIFMRSL